MARTLSIPRDREATGLAIMALRHYAAPDQAVKPSAWEMDVSKRLEELQVDKQAAATMISHFDRIRPSVRARFLGASYDAKIKVPDQVPVRTFQQFTTTPAQTPNTTWSRLYQAGVFGRLKLKPLPPGVILPALDYTLTYEGLYCIEESVWDRGSWSDEPYVISSAVHITKDGKNVVRTERHPFAGDPAHSYYTGVDTGETRVGPRAACWKATVADVAIGMSLTTVVMEHDEGDPDAYRKQVDAAVKLALAVVGMYFPAATPLMALIAASGLVTDFFNWLLGTGDDEVGSSTQVFTFSDLETESRSGAGEYWHDADSHSQNVKSNFWANVNNKYAAGYKVWRNPEAPPLPIIVE